MTYNCLFCFKEINKKKGKFCNNSCAAKYNNQTRVKLVRIYNQKSIPKNSILLKTKKELFDNRTNWQSARSAIQKSARSVYLSYNKPYQCFICSYSNHIEIAHIKSVSSFSEETKIIDINHISNLIALCPNHHWEFDNGLLELNKI